MKRKLLTILLATAACGALIGAVGCTGESSSGGGGTEWFTGTASPTEQIEADLGDFYLDEDDFDIYKFTEITCKPFSTPPPSYFRPCSRQRL